MAAQKSFFANLFNTTIALIKKYETKKKNDDYPSRQRLHRNGSYDPVLASYGSAPSSRFY